MAFQATINRKDYIYEEDQDDEQEDEERNPHPQTHEYDEEIDETEDDLIENYLYLTRRCNALRHSPTTSVLNTMQQHTNHGTLVRQSSLTIDHDHFERSLYASKHCTSLNDFNNNNNNYQTHYSSSNRIPPTIYYDDRYDDQDYYGDGSFSLVKLFARMKARLKYDRRYKPNSTHELLREEDSPEWFELTKNTRDILSKALLPNGGYDAIIRQNRTSHTRQHSRKRSCERDPVLSLEIEDDASKIQFDIDDELNTEGDEDFDQIIWKKFLDSPRGFYYRRCGVCKAVDRQQFQGQLVYVYGVANNILIDENLKASGLG